MNELIRYCQVVEMTDEEKIAMYSKLTKKQLIVMLMESNKHLNYLVEVYNGLHTVTSTDIPTENPVKPWHFNYP